MKALDLFAGPGGWDVGARELGIDPLGIEWDEAACATREAAGLPTVRADVAALTPSDFAPVDLLIASPPCQAWSMAGKRAGERDQEHVYACTDELARGIDRRAEHRGACEDERSILVVEPVRWALALRPRFIACEQVPPVLDYWRYVARILEAEGYATWAGILSAERYGVPQTRKRAILMARLDGPVHPPAPTHQEYRPGEPAWPAPQLTLEGEIKPWVSMAEALGWAENEATGQATALGEGMVERHGEREPRQATEPAPHITGKTRSWERVQVGFPRRDDTGTSEDGYRERDWRNADEPAFNLTEKARSWEKRSVKRVLVNNAQANAARRGEDEPAPTITAAHDNAQRVWVENRPAPTVTTTRRSDRGMLIGRQLPEGEGRNVGGKNWTEGRPSTAVGEQSQQPKLRTHANTRPNEAEHRRRPDGLTRDLDDPAPTLDSRATGWTVDRPATAVMGDARIFPGPRAERDPNYQPGDDAVSQGNPGGSAVRVTVQEAAILQGFPPDYPWQGSRTKQFQQIGNAVPPPLARSILAALTEGAG